MSVPVSKRITDNDVSVLSPPQLINVVSDILDVSDCTNDRLGNVSFNSNTDKRLCQGDYCRVYKYLVIQH